ncbi:MAG: C69 family dipeptidase, partial [Bacteroidales bacterium]|nr:C69 family dipeptidase [Bacteroidales bacterium]
SCTSIMVGKKATTDGSVITSHTCDGRYRTWLKVEKSADHADTIKHKVYKGTLKTETAWDMRKVSLAGEIPQVNHTYAYLNTAYPCLNEKQLAIGETTFVGPKELVNEKGMFLIEELQRIALQRCTNARQAIKLIGKLIKEYGYGDWGECITIADKNEVWQMEIVGEGKNVVGGIWAAQRIPDGHVGISANISRIGELDLKNKDFFMASDNVFDAAKKLNRWDGKEPFKFWKAYGDTEKPYKEREYFVLNYFAPSLNLNMDMDELPFSVKPEKKVSVIDVTNLYRATYEGTDLDMNKNLKVIKKKYNDKREVTSVDTIKSPIANPWLSRNARNTYNYLSENTVKYQRTVAVSWCSYSHIIQLRSWLPDEIGGIAWFSFDNPAQSPRVPIYSGTLSLPQSYNFCGQKKYRDDAAIWRYRKANKLATLAWERNKKEFMKHVIYFETKGISETKAIEKQAQKLIQENKVDEAKNLITHYTRDFIGSTMLKWEELERFYWHKFGLGF